MFQSAHGCVLTGVSNTAACIPDVPLTASLPMKITPPRSLSASSLTTVTVDAFDFRIFASCSVIIPLPVINQFK